MSKTKNFEIKTAKKDILKSDKNANNLFYIRFYWSIATCTICFLP